MQRAKLHVKTCSPETTHLNGMSMTPSSLMSAKVLFVKKFLLLHTFAVLFYCSDVSCKFYVMVYHACCCVLWRFCIGGIANGIVWWFEADMCPASRDQSSSIVTWSGAEAAAGAAGMTAASPAEAELPSVSSWNQAWQYIDDVEMEHGAKVRNI